MTRPLIVFPDPVVVTLAVLRGAFSEALTLEGIEHKVSRSMPERDADTARADVLVADDGDAGEGSRVHETALVRVTTWDRDEYLAMYLARQAKAHLLKHPGDSRSAGFYGATRPLPSTDPDDGTPTASFTIIARLKAE